MARQVVQSGQFVLRAQEESAGKHEAEERAADGAADAGEELEAGHQQRRQDGERDDQRGQERVSPLLLRHYIRRVTIKQ